MMCRILVRGEQVVEEPCRPVERWMQDCWYVCSEPGAGRYILVNVRNCGNLQYSGKTSWSWSRRKKQAMTAHRTSRIRCLRTLHLETREVSRVVSSRSSTNSRNPGEGWGSNRNDVPRPPTIRTLGFLSPSTMMEWKYARKC